MAEISKGHTFNDGDVVHGSDLNNAVDLATALKGIVLDQGSAAPVSTDSIVYYNAVAADLRRCTISQLPGAGTVTSVSMTVAPSAIFSVVVVNPTTAPAIAFTTRPQLANAVLAGPVTGSGIPTFRALVPTDIPIATVPIAALQINWDLGSTFSKTLAANSAFTFTNQNAGQTIRVLILQDASHTVAWPGAVRWPNGTVPVMTTGGGRVDIYTFHFIGGVLYGTAQQNFL